MVWGKQSCMLTPCLLIILYFDLDRIDFGVFDQSGLTVGYDR